jgi:hypothetical protein
MSLLGPLGFSTFLERHLFLATLFSFFWIPYLYATSIIDFIASFLKLKFKRYALLRHGIQVAPDSRLGCRIVEDFPAWDGGYKFNPLPLGANKIFENIFIPLLFIV